MVDKYMLLIFQRRTSAPNYFCFVVRVVRKLTDTHSFTQKRYMTISWVLYLYTVGNMIGI